MKVQAIPLNCIVCILGITLAGCASAPPHNAKLSHAEAAYSSASGNAQVAEAASDQLQAASANLDKARAALKHGKPATDVNHYAYLAKRHVAIARQTGRAHQAEASMKQARKRRRKLQRQARQQSAREAQMKTAAAEARANRAQKQAEAAREQAASAEQKRQQLAQQLSDLKAKETARGLVLTLGNVQFALNKADLRSGGKQAVGKLAKFMKKYPKRNVMVEGYTDSTGSADYNQTLSEQRADSVRDALVSDGIDPQRIVTKGFGEQYPVASNATREGRQRNRRVEIVISDKNGTFPKKR
jgi:outer membrane protein OmpA-like peptidoglycan-associated protein